MTDSEVDPDIIFESFDDYIKYLKISKPPEPPITLYDLTDSDAEYIGIYLSLNDMSKEIIYNNVLQSIKKLKDIDISYEGPNLYRAIKSNVLQLSNEHNTNKTGKLNQLKKRYARQYFEAKSVDNTYKMDLLAYKIKVTDYQIKHTIE